MLKINLINPTKSDVAYQIITFPDGEKHLVLNEELDRKENYTVTCRITSADELFILLQLGQILDTSKVEWQLYITYLMSQRMDRIMTWKEAMSLDIVGKCLSTLQYTHATILEPHSVSNTKRCVTRSIGNSNITEHLLSQLPNDTIICFPDYGAYQRYILFLSLKYSYMTFKKVRDVETGKIIRINQDMSATDIDCEKEFRRITLIDDLCDGGGTFLLVHQELRKKWGLPIDIIVTHMVNEKGLENLAKTFDQVYITNSYKDWDVTKYPNVILTSVY